MVSGLLHRLWSRSSLVAELRSDIFKLFATVEALSLLLKVPLHHINVLVVSIVVHTRVPHDADSELVETLSHFLALDLPLLTLLEVGLEVDDGDFLQLKAVSV